MSDSPGILFKVVAIRIHGINKTIDTFALLDDGSQVSIIDEELANDLGLQQHFIT